MFTIDHPNRFVFVLNEGVVVVVVEKGVIDFSVRDGGQQGPETASVLTPSTSTAV